MTCADASPGGLGAAYTDDTDPELLKALWRHRDRRGLFTYLCGRGAEWTLACGTDRDRADLLDVLLDDDTTRQQPPDRALLEIFDVIVIGSLEEQPLQEAMSQEGLRTGPFLNGRLGPCFDPLDDGVLTWVIGLVRAGRV